MDVLVLQGRNWDYEKKTGGRSTGASVSYVFPIANGGLELGHDVRVPESAFKLAYQGPGYYRLSFVSRQIVRYGRSEFVQEVSNIERLGDGPDLFVGLKK